MSQTIYHTPALDLHCTLGQDGRIQQWACCPQENGVQSFPADQHSSPPLHLGHVQHLPGIQPSTIQCVPERAMSHIECLPLWKGGILVLKYDHEEEMLADISYVDVRLCHALVQTAIIRR